MRLARQSGWICCNVSCMGVHGDIKCLLPSCKNITSGDELDMSYFVSVFQVT